MSVEDVRYNNLMHALERPMYGHLVDLFENHALDMADEIVVRHNALDDLLVVGMGGEFEEFCAHVCASLEHHSFNVSVNCFWPYKSFNPNLTGLGPELYDENGRLLGETLIHLEASYIEDPNSSFDLGIILTSVLADAEPVKSILRRTKEVADCKRLELRCLIATQAAVDELQDLVVVEPMVVAPKVPRDYWQIEELLDVRPAKMIPRQSRWLVGRRYPELRLEKTYGSRP
ncbi:hypothetical protein NFO65_18555 [Neorhizobium galegae]|uniref:hypothetical protein n=1 Tax=Neorhizobium galegae TaxID=399 RepID=UPI0021017480|nr:hypothetical protein [Neorhizobium galegae]MCQ1572733.1 hypothetical protein [Neorhizobium galegae]